MPLAERSSLHNLRGESGGSRGILNRRDGTESRGVIWDEGDVARTGDTRESSRLAEFYVIVGAYCARRTTRDPVANKT